MSIWTMLGGPVFWLLTALGVTSVLLFFNRLVALRRAEVDYADFVRGVGNVLAQNNPDEALVLCDETPSPVARVVAETPSAPGTPSLDEILDSDARARRRAAEILA